MKKTKSGKVDVETVRTLPCSCKNQYQDKMYGLGQRAHNFAPKKDKAGRKWRCTVCGNMQ